jgi:hypothetical protein
LTSRRCDIDKPEQILRNRTGAGGIFPAGTGRVTAIAMRLINIKKQQSSLEFFPRA